MTNHLRRILLAKSVVDCGKGDKRFSNTRSRAKTPVSKKERNIVAGESLSDKMINRLAYDTRHHPHEVANMSWMCNSGKYSSRKNCVRSNSTDSSEDLSLRDHRSTSKNYGDKFRAGSTGREFTTRSSSSPRQLDKASNRLRKKHRTGFEEPAVDSSGDSEDLTDVKKFGQIDGKEQRRLRLGAIQSTRSGSDISFPRTPEFLASTPNVDSERFNDVSMYVKFVYDITKEVMEKGYYSDREIERVVEKHFEKNLGRLNENKMLREINSLKKALDIKYDCEEEEEEEEEKEEENATSGFPPKSKFSSFEKSKVDKRVAINASIPFRQDPQVLKTRNKNLQKNLPKEIIVTKEDILTTLLEMDFNPEKAEEICKSLENRSKEVYLSQKNQLSNAKEADEKDFEKSIISETNELRKSNDYEETTLGSSPAELKKEDPLISKGKNSPCREISEKLEKVNGGIKSERNESEEITKNLDTGSRFSVSNNQLEQKEKDSSSSGEKSGVLISGEEKIIREEQNLEI